MQSEIQHKGTDRETLQTTATLNYINPLLFRVASRRDYLIVQPC